MIITGNIEWRNVHCVDDADEFVPLDSRPDHWLLHRAEDGERECLRGKQDQVVGGAWDQYWHGQGVVLLYHGSATKQLCVSQVLPYNNNNLKELQLRDFEEWKIDFSMPKLRSKMINVLWYLDWCQFNRQMKRDS